MEGLVVTVLLALLWEWIAWTIGLKFPRLSRVVAVAVLSGMAFSGFFVTTVYLSHGRTMSLVEGLQVFCGLLVLNVVLVSVKASLHGREAYPQKPEAGKQ